MATYYIEISDNDITTMNEKTGDIVLSTEYFVSKPSIGDIVDIRYDEDSEDIKHRYEVKNYNESDHTVDLLWKKQLKESTLVEAPVIKLSDDELNNPAEVNLKNMVARATEQERVEQENKARAEKEQLLKDKYANAIEELNRSVKNNDTPVETLEVLFDSLVPSSGPAESVAGELVRATMRILYRDANDGDKFFEGYGIETCGSSASYLFDQGFESDIQDILDNSYQLSSDDDKYTEAITLLAEHVVDRIKEDNSLLWTINEVDSRDYSYEYIEENQPRYEFELQGSDDVVTLVENGVLTAWDLNEYVAQQLSYESRYFKDAEVGRPWTHTSTSVTVENLTRDGYDYLEDSFTRNPDGWWSDLTSEYADELNSSDDDDDYDED